jgi:hypothetical protein
VGHGADLYQRDGHGLTAEEAARKDDIKTFLRVRTLSGVEGLEGLSCHKDILYPNLARIFTILFFGLCFARPVHSWKKD